MSGPDLMLVQSLWILPARLPDRKGCLRAAEKLDLGMATRQLEINLPSS